MTCCGDDQTTAATFGLVLLSFILPPLAVYISFYVSPNSDMDWDDSAYMGRHIWFCITLGATICGYLPGVCIALFFVMTNGPCCDKKE
ncbi:hypothetical protein C9374_001122 [Naegleria lovaniensis]|uniref:Uncharacterized protein n=1 Tax=Naegleria lovaniensis TaxID=51637 RepID=A0AA88GDG4_NAELO|nr:uncharacterized protein C9374_013172 [Naegleria lovaniensis]XP_044551520.1 uncharacterized protein C9374_001122 [Naegleria lovaniensis]KAG2372808.1 hypothetical protein C9374_013172 [Naegleria lovaniensis]KAG2387528.1 hypothetical protein C9374_001122 [Naegleria lovaniensis]